MEGIILIWIFHEIQLKLKEYTLIHINLELNIENYK